MDQKLTSRKRDLENQIEFKKRECLIITKEIESLEVELSAVNLQLNQNHCKQCQKLAPMGQRLATAGGIYCLDCGFEVLDLLKGRNEKREQDYREFYEEIKKHNANKPNL